MARLKTVVATAAAAALASGLVLAGGSHYVKILSEPELGQAWVPTPGQARIVVGYPEAASDRHLDACVNIGYLIDARGRTSKFVELSSWSSADPDKLPSEDSIAPYTQLAAAVLARRSFAPVGKPHPVYTSENFSFAGSGSMTPEAIAGHCRIQDLEALVTGHADQRIQKPILRSRYETRIQRWHQCDWFSGYCALNNGE